MTGRDVLVRSIVNSIRCCRRHRFSFPSSLPSLPHNFPLSLAPSFPQTFLSRASYVSRSISYNRTAVELPFRATQLACLPTRSGIFKIEEGKRSNYLFELPKTRKNHSFISLPFLPFVLLTPLYFLTLSRSFTRHRVPLQDEDLEIFRRFNCLRATISLPSSLLPLLPDKNRKDKQVPPAHCARSLGRA